MLHSGDTLRILVARGLRAFADGVAALLLPAWLLRLGFGPLAIGSIITATLLGSAVLTLAAGMFANRLSRRDLLGGAALLMFATGIGFAAVQGFWPILLVGFIGTLNPTSGDVSLFLPLEQTMLAEAAAPGARTAVFARYALVGTLLGALGTLAAALPDWLAGPTLGLGLPLLPAMRGMFLLYGALGLAALVLYRRLSPALDPPMRQHKPLGPSRGIVLRLAAVFSIDSFGGGFMVQSLIALWLYRRYGVSVPVAATILFWANIFSAVSALAAAPLARRIGLIRTMVFTHIPAHFCLVGAALAPDLRSAVVLLLLRSALSQMDVPARNSFVMAVVTPAERPAASSITALPRSLAAAGAPVLAGWLLAASSFAWPLLIGAGLKLGYDLILLALFRAVPAPEER